MCLGYVSLILLVKIKIYHNVNMTCFWDAIVSRLNNEDYKLLGITTGRRPSHPVFINHLKSKVKEVLKALFTRQINSQNNILSGQFQLDLLVMSEWGYLNPIVS